MVTSLVDCDFFLLVAASESADLVICQEKKKKLQRSVDYLIPILTSIFCVFG